MKGTEDHFCSEEWNSRMRTPSYTEITFVLEHYLWHLANANRSHEFMVSKKQVFKFLDDNYLGELKDQVIDSLIDLPHTFYILEDEEVWPYLSIVYSDHTFFIKLDQRFMKHISHPHAVLDRISRQF